MAAVLAITDGTTRIDLITGAFTLKSWTPSVAPLKNGGEWADSALADGRCMTLRKRANAVEQFNLTVSDASQNLIIRETQDLRRLLETALDYWTSRRGPPVWVEARASCETNTRYAVIKGYDASRDDDPNQSPFVGSSLVAMEDWTLVIERGDWLGEVPGTSTCVELSAVTQYSLTGSDFAIFYPTQSDDDAYVEHSAGTINTAGTTLYTGWNSPDITQVWSCGIRFRNVTVPAGATVTYAILRLVADENDSGTASLDIWGDSNPHPAVFSTYADFISRSRTANHKDWNIGYNWVAGTKYSVGGADLIATIQEIIDAPGWAAGHNLTLIIDGRYATDYRRASSWDHLTDDPPELEIGWLVSDTDLGRTASCLNEVFVSNKQNVANITDAYYYDASGPAWSANLQTAALPFSFLPAVPAVGDMVYFGCDTSMHDSGPFGSIVFDIGTAAANITALYWEYWSGAAWTAWAWPVVPVDCARGAGSYFGSTGVRTVCWEQPSNWATTSVNGVTGYWIRARVASVLAGATAPTQQHRIFYSVTRPSVDIDAAEVEGDLPALLRAYICNWSNYYNSSLYVSGVKGAILALRSVDRGENFKMYLNASDEQNPIGVDVALGASATFATDATAPSGRSVAFSLAGAGTAYMMISLAPSIAGEFQGRYRAFVRGHIHAANWSTMTLQVGRVEPFFWSGGGTSYYQTVTVPIFGDGFLTDFGQIDVPGFETDDLACYIEFKISATSAAGGTGTIYDLILVPVDEWAAEFAPAAPDTVADRFGIAIPPDTYRWLDVSSHGRNNLSAIVRDSIADLPGVYGWKSIGPRPAILQANKDQRLYVMTRDFTNGTREHYAPIWDVNSIRAFALHRYLSMRGNR